MANNATISDSAIEAVFRSHDPADAALQGQLHELMTHPLYTFQPRPDRPNESDEQSAFVNDHTSTFSICLGGTGSGKTEAAAYKTACYVYRTKPHRPLCPFWVIGDTFDMTCQVCWNEKLSKYIRPADILSTDWYKSRRNWPRAVVMRDPDDRTKPGWVIEFKSYEQGLSSMKAASIGGYWFNEEVPYDIVQEVQGRCRDYNSPGWADFTPIEVRSPEWPELCEDPPEGWAFYHLNTRMNTALAEGWADAYLSQIPEDMLDTRETGKFTILRGQVFKEFRKSMHVIEPFRIPNDWRRTRGIDFGFNNPYCCLWVARDRDDRYYVYDEHFKSQELQAYHANAINEREWGDGLPWFGPTYSDHDSQEVAELTNYGILCTLASKAINPGITMLRSLMMIQGDGRPRLFIFKQCANLIREIIGYKWPEGTTGRNPADVPLDKDNHAIDAMRYAIYSDRVKMSDTRPTTGRARRDHARHGVLLNRHGR